MILELSLINIVCGCFISLATTAASPSKWAKVLIDLANQRPIHLRGFLVSNFWVWKRDGSRNVKGELAPGLANFHNPPSHSKFAHGSFYSHSNSIPCLIYLPNVSMCGIFTACHRILLVFQKKKFRVSAEKRPRCFCNGWHPNMSRYLHALNFETKMIHKKWNTWNQSPSHLMRQKYSPTLRILDPPMERFEPV